MNAVSPLARGWKPHPAFKRKVAAIVAAAPEQAANGVTLALKQSGEEAVAVIKPNIPVGKRANPKRLADSLDWNFGDPPPGVLGAGDYVADNAIPEHLRISIYAGGKKAPHAHLVHNGTAPRERKDGRSTGIAPPQPFFFPYIRALRKRFRNRILRKSREGLKRAFKK